MKEMKMNSLVWGNMIKKKEIKKQQGIFHRKSSLRLLKRVR